MIIFPYVSIQDKSLKYSRVTEFLSSFEPPFDAKEVAEKVSNYENSEYYGHSVESILEMWRLTGIRGDQKHKQIENWLRSEGPETSECTIIKNTLGINPENTYAEIKLYANRFSLTGTPDIVQQIDPNTFIVHDIKTFKKVSDDKIDKASKQILTYCAMLKEIISNPDIKVKAGKIIIIQPSNNISDNTSFEFEDPIFLDINKYVLGDLKFMLKTRIQI